MQSVSASYSRSHSIQLGIAVLASFMAIPITVVVCATALFGQEGASNDAPSITIADQPKTVDPATLIPDSLAAKLSVDFDGAAVREVADWIGKSCSIPVLIDQRALDDEGVSLNETVIDRLDDQPLYLLLNRLRALSLDWYVDSNVLHITSASHGEERMTTRPYNVANLLDADIGHGTIVDTIEGMVAVDSWDSAGGEAVAELLGDVLFVRQSERRHLEVKGLLTALEHHGRQTYVSDPSQHIVIRERLASNVTVAFDDTPLEEAVEQLARDSNVDLRLDWAALRKGRIRGREPVTLLLADRSLQVVLQVMLQELQLDWVLRDGVLWITTEDAAAEVEKTAVYDVRDLCRNDAEADSLQDAIVSQTEADQWAEVGGEADLTFPLPGTMVVVGQEQVHRSVLDLLEKYRTALRSSKPRKNADPKAEVATLYYRVYTSVAMSLELYLPRAIEPDSWTIRDASAIGTIEVLASSPVVEKDGPSLAYSVMVIRQTRAVHEEIAKTIGKVLNGDAYSADGSSGMGGGGGGFGGGMFDVPSDSNLDR